MRYAPFLSYCPSSISNSISSWAQYEALKYLSFPVQTLSKSCKIIPVMLVGILVNKKKYPVLEYIEAAVITAGVLAFSLAGGGGGSSQRRHHAAASASLTNEVGVVEGNNNVELF
jgi:adenosine 3'-phospho 5'-phosphosulfate transporter B2